MKKWCGTIVALALCMVVSHDAMAQPSLGLKAVGFQAGLVSPEDMDATFGLGAFADLGMLTPNVRLRTHLDYWSKSEDEFGAEFSVRDITLGARAHYLIPMTSSTIQPYAGAGFGLHFLHAEMSDLGVTVDDSSTKLGIDLGGGLAWPMSPSADLMAELWYGIVDDASQMSMRAGMSFRLGS
jgi:Outer membrane protein beta-barrel domain